MRASLLEIQNLFNLMPIRKEKCFGAIRQMFTSSYFQGHDHRIVFFQKFHGAANSNLLYAIENPLVFLKSQI